MRPLPSGDGGSAQSRPAERRWSPVIHAADCVDCGWHFEHRHQERVTEALERHARKEQHQVEFTRRAVEAPI